MDNNFMYDEVGYAKPEIEVVVSSKYEDFAYRIASKACSKECALEGYPSRGSNYDLRMSGDGWLDYLPPHMWWDKVIN